MDGQHAQLVHVTRFFLSESHRGDKGKKSIQNVNPIDYTFMLLIVVLGSLVSRSLTAIDGFHHDPL